MDTHINPFRNMMRVRIAAIGDRTKMLMVFAKGSAAPLLIATVTLLAATSGCRKTEVDSPQQSADIFLPSLDPNTEQAVARLKEKNTIPIDEATRERIQAFMSELAHEHKFIDVNSQKQSRSTVALWELRKTGDSAFPQLIEAAASHSDPVVRQYALGIVHLIVKDKNVDPIEYLPIFVRSMWDKDARVRISAISQLGQMGRHFYRRERQKELEQLIPYFVKALNDADEIVRVSAGEILFRVGRQDLVPEELIKKYKIGTTQEAHHHRMSCDGFQPASGATSQSKELAIDTDISGLTAENQKDREKAAELVRKEHTELINDLIELAAEKVEPLPSSDRRFVEYPWHDSKHLAILLLGDLRASEAIPVLVENIEYKNPRRLWGSSLDKDGWYPAVEALSKIGMPAVRPTIRKLGSYPSKSQGSELCCWILKKILGVRLARLRLQIAIEETQDQAVKENLIAALPYFKTEREKAAEERARPQKDAG